MDEREKFLIDLDAILTIMLVSGRYRPAHPNARVSEPENIEILLEFLREEGMIEPEPAGGGSLRLTNKGRLKTMNLYHSEYLLQKEQSRFYRKIKTLGAWAAGATIGLFLVDLVRLLFVETDLLDVLFCHCPC